MGVKHMSGEYDQCENIEDKFQWNRRENEKFIKKVYLVSIINSMLKYI